MARFEGELMSHRDLLEQARSKLGYSKAMKLDGANLEGFLLAIGNKLDAKNVTVSTFASLGPTLTVGHIHSPETRTARVTIVGATLVR